MSLYDITVTRSDGSQTTLEEWRGKHLLIVNTASECGYTPQYEGLEALYREFKDRGFAVLGFPSNDFGGQEPGSDEAIQEFCRMNYGVSFPVFAKIAIKGADGHPLFKWLANEKRGILGIGAIKWNFTKFLVSPSGDVLKRYGSVDSPAVIRKDLVSLLG
ncbi:MAG: glutathione peroxidase [Acidimicrobiia bacterium]|jgi:glutathione peroxidase